MEDWMKADWPEVFEITHEQLITDLLDEMEALKRVEAAGRRVAKGKKEHKHLDGSGYYREGCQTCELMAALEELDAYREEKLNV